MKPIIHLSSVISNLQISLTISHHCKVGRLWDTFVNPSDETRTKLWWFHGETETTREGIDADLQAFKDAGIGGVVFYDQTHGNQEGDCPAPSPENSIIAAQDRSLISENAEKMFEILRQKGLKIVRCDKGSRKPLHRRKIDK